MTKYIISIFLLITSVSCQAGQENKNTAIANSHKQITFCDSIPHLQVHTTAQDSLIFKQITDVVAANYQDTSSTPWLIIELAKQFLQTPYVASTLEVPGDEQLIINLRELDCTTFIEYVLAMVFTVRQEKTGFNDFVQNLACIRYRDGNISGYPSRLHYVGEWLQNNAKKGMLEIISDKIGNASFDTRVNFMSSNAQLYRQLENKALIDSMIVVENHIATFQMNYIPKEQIESLENQIMDGDIIAFTTRIEGLDVSHTGFALHQQSRLYLLHASTRTMQVEITPVPLSDYLKPMRRVSGILVGRIK